MFKPHIDVTSNARLALHETNSAESLFDAMVRLFDARFARHSIVAGFRFHAGTPTTVIREGIVATNDDGIDYSIDHPGLTWLREHPGARIVRVSEVMPVPELKLTKYFQKVMMVEGWLHSVGLFFWIGYELIAMVGVNRTEAEGDFDDDEIAWCESVYADIEVAMKRVAAAEAERMVRFSLTELLFNVREAQLILDWDLRAQHCSDAARTLLARYWSVSISEDEPMACPQELSDACATLKLRVIGALQTNRPLPTPEPISLVANGNRRVTVRIELLRLSAEPLAWPMFAIRFMENDSHENSLPASTLNALTATELHLAMLVAYGHSNKELARILGKSALTVRNQLSSVFEKLAVRNRVELVAAIARSRS
jgi:DNA-binding CsgD family transcriptional regulator